MVEFEDPRAEAERLKSRLAELQVQGRYVPGGSSRHVSAPLAIGIFLLSIVFSWFLLRKGYSAKARVIGFGWMVLIILAAVGNRQFPTALRASSEGEVASDPVADFRPSDEAAFIRAVIDGKAAYEAAGNDMAKGGTRAKRGESICATLPSKTVAGWTGRIVELGSNSEGKGVLTIELSNGIQVRTWNNALSDIGSGTLIDPNSPLFTILANLKKGDPVRFSGTLFADRTDCVREMSFVSLDRSMTRPEFLMRFTSAELLTGAGGEGRSSQATAPQGPEVAPDPTPSPQAAAGSQGAGCIETSIAEIGTRLEGVPESGTLISYANGEMQVSYMTVPEVERWRVGDKVRLCLVPETPPPECEGRPLLGKLWDATNLSAGGKWRESSTSHIC